MQKTLAEMISSRICHDLISPVGAIGNGLELLTELSGPNPELELVAQSAGIAQAKLKYFRLAFGASGDGLISGAEARRLATEMFSMGRVSLSFSESWGDRERGLVKLFYLLLLCVESSLPRGGVITCAPSVSGWDISTGDAVVKAPDALWLPLTGEADTPDISAKTIQFLLARQALTERQLTLEAQFGERRLELSF